MEYAKKPTRRNTAKLTSAAARRAPKLAGHASHTRARLVQAFMMRPAQAQQQITHPIRRAARLRRQEEQHLHGELAGVQEQLQSLSQRYSPEELKAARERQAANTLPERPPLKPQSMSDWVTVMRFQAAQMEGRRVNSREQAQFTQLQRQVSQTLLQRYRADRQAPEARHAEYATHLTALQRHPLSAPVGHFFMNHVPSAERPALQRALSDNLEQQQTDRAELDTADRLDALQRQRNELQAQAARPVYQRILERRGAGNPLPEAVQHHLEHGLNYDLSKVRIHDDAEANKMAKGVNAIAFTTGTDIYFQSGKFNPNTQTGLELLAHEVTHTVQQSQGKVGKGIDPDSGLENQARETGRKLAATPVRPAMKRMANAPHFGLNSGRYGLQKRPRGQRLQPRTTLRQTLHAGTGGSLQRFGWKDIKKLASKGTRAIASKVNTARATVSRAAQRVTQSVKKVARPAIRAAQRTVKRATATVKRVARKATARIRSVGSKVRKYAAKRLSPLKKLARRAVKGVRRIGSGIKRGATKLAKRAAKTFSRARKAAGAFTRRVGNNIKRRAKGVLSAARKGAKQAFNKARTFVKKQVGPRVSKALSAASRLTRSAKGAMSKARSLAQKVSSKVSKGVKAVKSAASKVKNAYNKVKNSPRFKSFMSKAKEIGIQAASIGASIVVGGAIIAGAAALTVGTGGLAGPALVGALFASGAAGGAAGKLVENTLRGKKNKFEGINAKTILRDGALGVALGPLGRVAGKVVGKVAGVAGKGLARVGNRVAPKLTARLTSAGSSAKAAVGRKLTTAKNAASRVKNAFNNTRVGRSVNAVRSKVGKGLERTGVRISNAKNRALGTARSKISSGANRVRTRLGGSTRAKPAAGTARGQTRLASGRSGTRQNRTIRAAGSRGQQRAANAGRAGRTPTAGRNRRPQGGTTRRRPGGTAGLSARPTRGPQSTRPQGARRGSQGPSNRNSGPGRSRPVSIRLRNVAGRNQRPLVGQLSGSGQPARASASRAARPVMSNGGRPGPRGNAQTGLKASAPATPFRTRVINANRSKAKATETKARNGSGGVSSTAIRTASRGSRQNPIKLNKNLSNKVNKFKDRFNNITGNKKGRIPSELRHEIDGGRIEIGGYLKGRTRVHYGKGANKGDIRIHEDMARQVRYDHSIRGKVRYTVGRLKGQKAPKPGSRQYELEMEARKYGKMAEAREEEAAKLPFGSSSARRLRDEAKELRQTEAGYQIRAQQRDIHTPGQGGIDKDAFPNLNSKEKKAFDMRIANASNENQAMRIRYERYIANKKAGNHPDSDMKDYDSWLVSTKRIHENQLRGIADENARLDELGVTNNNFAVGKDGLPRTLTQQATTVDGVRITVRPDGVTDKMWVDVKSVSDEVDIYYFTRQLRAQQRLAQKDQKNLGVVLTGPGKTDALSNTTVPRVRPSSRFNESEATILHNNTDNGVWSIWQQNRFSQEYEWQEITLEQAQKLLH